MVVVVGGGAQRDGRKGVCCVCMCVCAGSAWVQCNKQQQGSTPAPPLPYTNTPTPRPTPCSVTSPNKKPLPSPKTTTPPAQRQREGWVSRKGGGSGWPKRVVPMPRTACGPAKGAGCTPASDTRRPWAGRAPQTWCHTGKTQQKIPNPPGAAQHGTAKQGAAPHCQDGEPRARPHRQQRDAD